MKNLFSSGFGGGLSKETPGCSLAVANDSSPAFWGFPPFLEEVFQTRPRTSATTAAITSATVTFGLDAWRVTVSFASWLSSSKSAAILILQASHCPKVGKPVLVRADNGSLPSTSVSRLFSSGA